MNIKIIAKHKRATFDYQLLERFEAGLVLVGTEVKSIKIGKLTLNEAYIDFDSNGEAWIKQMSVSLFEMGNRFNHEETRPRKLLLHKHEINELSLRSQKERLTIIPTMIFLKAGKIKIEIALAKGKKLHDKRESEKKKEIDNKLKRGIYD